MLLSSPEQIRASQKNIRENDKSLSISKSQEMDISTETSMTLHIGHLQNK